MPMRTIQPECRYCGIEVSRFGQICTLCSNEEPEDIEPDYFAELIRNDNARLAEKRDQ